MFSAIYIRQSIEKSGSLSLKGQKEMCTKYAANKQKVMVFEDNGWSGKNIERPAFENMMKMVEESKISEIIIYRFDRISRSLSDFLKIQDKLEKYNVRLISCSENFDTSNEIGKFMLRILIMFAEMERKSIVQRISDNYKTRAMDMKYLGGKIPYGYFLNNEKVMVCDKLERETIKKIFETYVENTKNCEKTARMINKDTEINKKFEGSSILKILKNVVYVEKSEMIERYFSDNNVTFEKGDCTYNGYIRVKNKIYPSKHKGFINAELWITAQKILKYQAKNKNFGKGETSVLQGLIKCSKCGRSVYVKSNGSGTTYLQCQGKRLGICNGYMALHASEIEKSLFNSIKSKMLKTEFGTEDNESKIKKYDDMLKNLSETDYDEFEKIYRMRNEYIDSIKKKQAKNPKNIILELENMWDMLEISDRKKILKCFIESVTIDDKSMTLFMK